jgi:hypothetical protein
MKIFFFNIKYPFSFFRILIIAQAKASAKLDVVLERTVSVIESSQWIVTLISGLS